MAFEPPATESVVREPSLLFVIPAFNEHRCIADVVRCARDAVPEADIVVIDDGSSDETAPEARRAGAFVLSHPFNLGIGGAVQTGLKFARRRRYDYVLRIDGDGQHDPRALRPLLASVRAGEADVVVGSRFLGGHTELEIPLLRRLGIELFAREVSWLIGTRATDPTSGLVVMNRRAVDVLAAYMPQDYPEVESRIILHAAGLATREAPVKMGERLAGASSIGRWRSAYYALKVSIAVLFASFKRTPRVATSNLEVVDARPAISSRGGYQRGSADGHDPARPPTSAT
ncbi:MAG: glycosyltransferase family 2 protein [Chloroflexota bacterium]